MKRNLGPGVFFVDREGSKTPKSEPTDATRKGYTLIPTFTSTWTSTDGFGSSVYARDPSDGDNIYGLVGVVPAVERPAVTDDFYYFLYVGPKSALFRWIE